MQLQGIIEVQGSPAALARSGVDFAELIGENENDEKKGSRTHSRASSIRSMSSASLIRSMSATSLCSIGGEPFDEIEAEVEPEQTIQMESSSKGKVKGSNGMNYFKAGAHWAVLAPLVVLFFIVQLCASGADYWVSYFTKQEELRIFFNNHSDSTAAIFDDNTTSMLALNDTNTDHHAIDSPWLSTETCIYVHGGLMLGLFILASIR